MKIIVIVFVANILSVGLAFAQNVAVNLSLEWDTCSCILESGNEKTPFLCITYTNNTGKDIYFKNLMSADCEYPNFRANTFKSRGSSFNVPDEIRYNKQYLAENYSEYPDSHRVVEIQLSYPNGILEILGGGWNVYDTVKSDNGDEMSVSVLFVSDNIKYKIQDLYDYEKTVCCGYSTATYNYDLYRAMHSYQISEKEILLAYKRFFVFLKNGESYKIRYNLFGFKKIRGSYDFVFEKSYKKDENSQIIDYPFSDDDNKKNLPAQVNGYELFDGYFSANHLSVKF